MKYYDVFNGDADGICALHQLRLATPCDEAIPITGVKRDIQLLAQITDIKEGICTVLDISLDSNREHLLTLLQNKNRVHYIDHHFCGEIPVSDFLTTEIDTAPETCTALIVNKRLGGKYGPWAICGAFGDNLHVVATEMALDLGLQKEEIAILQEIGELLNYNGYGSKLSDLHFHPADLYRAVAAYTDPFDFYENSQELQQLQGGYKSDMAQALAIKEHSYEGKNRVYFFPAEPWSRRVSGVFSNLKAREREDLAHAVISENSDSTLRISVRAPIADRRDADILCKSFPTGGGRKAAAGINALPQEMLHDFLQELEKIYG